MAKGRSASCTGIWTGRRPGEAILKAVERIFVSYTLDARKWTEKLAAALRHQNFEVWADFDSLAGEEPAPQQLEKALDGARVYVFVFGAKREVGALQDREWQAAIQRIWSDPSRLVIPVVLGPGETPPFLRQWPPLRFASARFEPQAAQQIVEAIRSRTRTRQRPPAEPGKDWLERLRLIEDTAKRWKAEQAPVLKRDV